MIKQIGRYEIRAELGRGGFGTVYRAFDPTVGRQVAIKKLSAGGDPELLTRFRNEAASAGKLHHKNIVTIHDFGEHEGEPFIVMELLEGMDLQRVIASDRALSLLQKMKIMDQVAEGLRHAHEKGVVHRDVKPANMMLLPDGNVKIMDFGIALVTHAANTRLTKTGTVAGTLRYMAPEQFRGSNNDPASDIFSYAVTYYELLSNRHPFDAPTQPALMYRIMSEEPEPVRAFLPDCPELLEQVLIRALHKDRDLRYQSFEDVQVDLRPLILELQQHRSKELTRHAASSADTGQFEAAQAAVREALELDPANREAVQLRRRLQQDSQRQVIRPRVEALLRTSKDLLAARRFEEAVSSLETAQNLERSNTEVQTLLNTARTSLRHKRKADQLTAEAQRALESGDINSAYQQASEALHTDPTNPGVEALVSQIRAEMESRDRGIRLQETLRLVRSAIAANSFDEAITLLQAAAVEFPNNAEVAALLERTSQNRATFQRRLDFEAKIEVVRDHLSARRFSEALHAMEAVAAAFPDFPEAREMLEYARQQHQMQRRSEHLSRLEKEIHGHLAGGRTEAAVEMAQKGIAIFPGEPAVQELLRQAVAARNDQRRQQAFEDLAARAAVLETNARYSEALGAVETFEEAYGQDAATRSLREHLESGFKAHNRREGIRHACDQGRLLLQQSNFPRAVELLEKAAADYDGDSEITALLAAARQKRDEQHRALEVERIATQAADLTRTFSFDEALKLIDAGLATHPGATGLQHARSEAAKAKREHDEREARERTIGEALEKGRNLLAQDAISKASHVVEQALKLYPSEPALTALQFRIEARQRELEAQQRENERKASLAAIDQRIRKDRFEEALAGIEAHTRTFGEDPGFPELRRIIEDAKSRAGRRQELDRAFKDASQRRDKKDYAGAIQILEDAKAAPGEHPQLSALLDSLQRRKSAIELAVSDARSALDSGDPDRAQSALKTVLKQYPDSTEIPPLLKEVQAQADAHKKESERQRRQAAIDQAIAEAQALTAANEPEQAVAILERAGKQYQAASELGPALNDARVHAERKKREQEQARKAEEQRLGNLAELQRLEARAGAATQPAALDEIRRQAAQVAAGYEADGQFTAVLVRIDELVATRIAAAATPAVTAPYPVPRRTAGPFAAVGIAMILGASAIYYAVRPDPQPAPKKEVVTRPEDPKPEIARNPTPPLIEPRVDPPKPVEPAPVPAGKPTGVLRISAGVRDADVFLDGALRGRTDDQGVFSATLEAKSWNLQIRKQGYRAPAAQMVDIGANARRALDLSLTPLEAQIQFEGGTPGAQVRLSDGKLLGTLGGDGRLAVKLPHGRHNLQITKDQFGPRSISRDFAPGELVTMGANEIGLTPIPKADPQAQVAQEWDKLKNSNDPAALEEFIRRNRNSPFAALAEARLDDLRWAAVNQKDVASLDEFARKYPSSRHKSEASTLAESLRSRLEMERLKTEQQNREAKAREAKAAVAAEKSGLQAALDRYERAFINKSADELKSAFPGIPEENLRRLSAAFKNRSVDIRMKLLMEGEPELRGDSAVVSCVQSNITVANRKASEPNMQHVKVTLSRAGGGWVIQSIAR